MSEDAEIRRTNLRSLKHDPKALMARAGKSYSYWRDLLGDSNKSFGEKAARALEQALDLPRGWLDEVHPTGKPVPAVPSRPQHVSLDLALPADITRRLAALDESQRTAVLRSLAAMLDAIAPPAPAPETLPGKPRKSA
jgi:hypothetical protein